MVWCGKSVILGSVADCGEPPAIHHSSGVKIAGCSDILRTTEYGVNTVPEGKFIMGSAAPVIKPNSEKPRAVGGSGWEVDEGRGWGRIDKCAE
jgi:hypothetical protein